MQQEVVPPRKGWSLLATETPRSPAKKQSTAHYARSMGVCRTPIELWTARSTIRMVLQTRALQGKTHNATCITEVCHATRKLSMHSCPQKLLNSRNPIENSSMQTKSSSMITTVTETSPTYLEVMGLVALGN